MRVEVTKRYLEWSKKTVWDIYVNGKYVWRLSEQSDVNSLASNLAQALGLQRRKGSVWTSLKAKVPR